MSVGHSAEIILNGVDDPLDINHSNPNIEPLFRGRPFTTFQGRTRLYRIQTIRSGSEHGFVEKIDDHHFQILPESTKLVGIIDSLYRSIYPERARRNPALTTTRILKGLSLPRTIAELILYEDVPVGYGIFPRLDAGAESLMYSSRAILSEHVREGLGTYILEDAIIRHMRETARWNRPLPGGFLMTQRWESIRSLEELRKKGVIESIQPIDEPFDERSARWLYIVHSQVRVNSTGIDSTGRSRGELSEVGYNENLHPPQEGTGGFIIHNKIVNHPPVGAGVNVYAGDVLYVGFFFPKQLPQMVGK